MLLPEGDYSTRACIESGGFLENNKVLPDDFQTGMGKGVFCVRKGNLPIACYTFLLSMLFI